MQQVPLEELVARSPHRMVRCTVGPGTHDAAWVRGGAVVVRGERHTLALGPLHDLAPLMHDLAPTFVPDRLSVDEASRDDVPGPWAFRTQGHWHWMWTDSPAPELAVDGGRVEELAMPTSTAEVDGFLDVAMPDSRARPGSPGTKAWLGVRGAGDGRLLAVGTVRRDPAGSGHLQGICVLPGHTGRGLGRALSAALTRRAMDRPPHLATLGVYVDNAPALHVYDALGYRAAHTVVSGRPGAP